MEEQTGVFLNPERILQKLRTDNWSIHYKESVDSTNNWAKIEARKGAASGSVYLADTQTAGKGSRGRSWGSPEGTSIAMSMVLRPRIELSRVPMVTLVLGLAAADGIRAASDSDIENSIKWPNDVVCDGRKLCGILTEMGGDGKFIVPGIGVNVNVDHFSEELADKATSMYMLTGKKYDRDLVAAEILNYFDRYYRIFLQTGDLAGIIDRYESVLANRGKMVRVLQPDHPFNGLATGIDKMGRLLVRREDNGEMEKIFAGE
ncbi:MAG: biotin--[acetyl-CoA-carboxylase] ligase, partial [Bilifractor sp.]